MPNDQNSPSLARARDLIAVVSDPALPDPKVAIYCEEDGRVVEIWVHQDPKRRYARRQHIGLSIAQAKQLREALGATIEDAERRNAVVGQQRRGT